jgi:hypothetical protein
MADQQDRPERDVDLEDPRGKEVGEGGYAEEQPGGDAGGRVGRRPGERERPDADPPGDDEAADRAPSTSSPSDSEPGESTGNPGAAGA